MARTRTRALTAATALLAALALVMPTAAPAFGADGAPYITVTSASQSYAHGTENVTFTATIHAAPPACLGPDHDFELHYELSGAAQDEGVWKGGHTVLANSLVFTYVVGTVSGPATYMFYAQTDDPCLNGASFGESYIIDIEPSTAGTLISGTVYEQQVAGSTDPGDYARRQGVQITLRDPVSYEYVASAKTGPDGTYVLLAPFDDEHDENSQYILTAEVLNEWDLTFYFVAGADPASPSTIDWNEATVFTADPGTSYDFYAGRPPGVDATNIEYLCYYGNQAVSQHIQTDLVEWEYVCGTDGTIVDAELVYTDDAFDGFGYVAFPATVGRVPDRDDINYDYFATIDDAEDVDITTTETGAVVRYRDEDATVRNDAGDFVEVDVEVELVIDGQWARWTVDVYDAGTTTLADDVTFYFVGALGSSDDTVWMGDAFDGVLVSWDGGASDRPVVGHRQTGGEQWHVSNGSPHMSLRGHESLAYEVALIDVCPDNMSLEDALAPVAGADFGDVLDLLGEACPTLPDWPFTAPEFQVGESFDQIFTAPTQDPWDWAAGGSIDVYDLPDGLDWEMVDQWEDGVAPGVRIFGTPTTEGDYRFSIFLQDNRSHYSHFPVDGTVAPEGPWVYDGEDTIHGVVYAQQKRGDLTPGGYAVQEGLNVALVAVDYGTWWAGDVTDEHGRFTLTAPVSDEGDETMSFALLVEVDGLWYYYQDGASFGDPSTRYLDEATLLRPIEFDGDASYDVYAGRDVGVPDTDVDELCAWNGDDWQDVRTATAYWWYLCLADGSIGDAATSHADDALDGWGNVVFPARLDRLPTSYSFRLDYFVTADEYTITDTSTGAVLTLIDRDVEVWDATENLVDVDVEITVEISGSWARWRVKVYYAGSSISADDVPFYFVGNLGSDELTLWESAPGRAVSWDGGDGDPFVGHRVSSFDTWTYAYGDDEVLVAASGELTYELAVAGWCDGGVGDPMADLLATLDTAAFGSAVAALGGVCEPQPTWDFPALDLTVGVPFDQTFTAPTDGLWNWSSGGVVQSFDLPDGLSVELLDMYVPGTPPALRIHGTPTTAGPYRFSVQLDDHFGHSVEFYVPGRVAPVPDPDDEFPTDPAEIDIDFGIGVGDPVAGGEVTVTAHRLLAGADFDLTVRSTPQVLAQGIVPGNGTVIRTATLPTLAAGWHSLTFTSTWGDGVGAIWRVWFLVSSTGTLLEISSTAPTTGTAAPGLANTGGDVTGSLLLGSVTLLAGLGLVALRRRRSATV
jgi:hypothetical protein